MIEYNEDISLSLIILSWNTLDITVDCVDSILEYPPSVPWELILIDNASSDGSADALDEKYRSIPHIRMIKNEVNLGFTGGNNQGMELATGDIVGLLNSDTVISKNSLTNLYNYLVEHKQVGVVGPWLTHDDGSPTTSFGYFPAFGSIFTTAFLPGWIYGNQRKALGVIPDSTMTEPMSVDYVSGAAFFIKREVLNSVGKFDSETFFAYFEETDLCLRIKKAGWQIRFLPSEKIVHLEGKSFEKMTSHRRLMQYDSAKKFLRKHYSIPMIWWYQFCTVLGSLVKIVYFGLRILMQPSRRDRWLPHFRWNMFVFDLWKKGFSPRKKEAGS